MELYILIGASLIFASIMLTPASARIGAPLLLLFLAIGMLAGEDGPGGLVFNNFQIAYEIGAIALAIILFAGGLTTPMAAVRKALVPSGLLATFGVVLTCLITGFAAMWLLNFSWVEGFLLGAVVASTDAAATFMLMHNQGVQLRGRLKETLILESGLNDPTAIFLTILFVSLITQNEATLTISALTSFLQQMGLGLALGIAGGMVLSSLLNRVRLPQNLASVLALAGAMMLFSGVQLIGGSGFLAIYLCGIIFAERCRRSVSVTQFHDTLAWLSQITLFLLLGLLVNPGTLGPQLLTGILLACVLMFIARPAAVATCLLPLGFTLRETLLVGWVGLRGAVPIFLAIIPIIAPGPIGNSFFNIVFILVVASLICQGWTITPIAKWLGLQKPTPTNDWHAPPMPVPTHHDHESMA